MLLSAHLLLAIPALAVAQHVHFRPEWVQSVVASCTSEFAPFVTYHGPPKGSNVTAPQPYGTGRPHRPSPSGYPGGPDNTCSYWLENIAHQGKAPFQSNSGYQVFRNVKDFGAKGDGVTDDTVAINLAISSGNRCAPGTCASSTTTPALVYFPAGTYVISSSIIDYYYTNLIGNPNCLPVLQATANFTGLGLIDGDQYGAKGLSYGSTNVFFRQVRNLILDMTDIPFNSSATGVHWPTAQATSLQNVVFNMSDAKGTQHQGLFIEEGSGGFMTDLVFLGGLYGLNVGNQQFTMRNLSISNAVTAINQLWDWGWTYKGIYINNCSVGLNMSSGGVAAQTVGSITLFDSEITNTPVGVITAHNASSLPPAAGSLILENVKLNNVPVAVQGPQGTVLAGTTGSSVIAAWGEGHAYTPNGPNYFEGPITPNSRPASLTVGGAYYQRSKPQYERYPSAAFLSVRSAGAAGDGVTDDTAALQKAIKTAVSQRRVLFIDAGDYKVTSTIYIPAGAMIVGEAYPVILGSGAFFSDATKPAPVVQVGKSGEKGSIEWSDVIVSTQGATAGAIFVEWNLASSSPSSQPPSSYNGWPSRPGWGSQPSYWPGQQPSGPSGMWDVHVRVGGFAGSNLQLAQCPTTPAVATPPAPVNKNCICGFMSMHVTTSASNLYMENVWLWTADHDIEDPALTQITLYNGRGLYIESGSGPLWLYGTAVEHHVLYEYQLSHTTAIFMGQIQTETAYYQPNPPAPLPITPQPSVWNDPTFPDFCLTASGYNFTSTPFSNPCDGWGLRVLNSSQILIYGAGLYSFFDNYNTTCSAAGNGASCQTKIFDVEGTAAISVYNLNTIGSQSMIDVGGVSVASYADNVGGFQDTIALFRPSS